MEIKLKRKKIFINGEELENDELEYLSEALEILESDKIIKEYYKEELHQSMPKGEILEKLIGQYMMNRENLIIGIEKTLLEKTIAEVQLEELEEEYENYKDKVKKIFKELEEDLDKEEEDDDDDDEDNDFALNIKTLNFDDNDISNLLER